MQITKATILAIAPNANAKIVAQLPASLNYWLPKYGMANKLVVAMFLAQAAEETDGFKTLREYASGAAYEGRKDLGNTQPGDGVRFAGEGIFMQTGRTNYTKEVAELGLDLVNHPDLLLIVDNAVHAACQYWQDHKLTPLALTSDIVGVTQKINGGQNGVVTRKLYYTRALKIITEDITKGNVVMLTGIKTYLLTTVLGTLSATLATTGAIDPKTGIGGALVAAALFALRHGLATSTATIIASISGVISTVLSSMGLATEATIADTVKAAVTEALAEQAAATTAATVATAVATPK